MFCKKCGNILANTDNFCTNCSNPTPWFKKNNTSIISTKPSLDIKQFHVFFEKIWLLIKIHYKKISILFIVIIIGIIVFFLFIVPNPKKDAKKIALLTYEYENKYDSLKLEQYKKFNSDFETHKYKNRTEANNDLEAYLLVASQVMAEEEQNLKILKQKTETKYIKDYNKQTIYNNELIENQKKYIRKFLLPIENSHNTSLRKINSIIGNLPSIEKITSDLIGNTLVGIWRFDYISEIKELNIISSKITGQYSELIVSIKAGNDNTEQNKSYYFKKVLIQYYLDDSGNWNMNNITCNQYDFNISIKYEWFTFNVPTNCTYKIYCNGKQGYAREYGFWSWGESVEIGDGIANHFSSNQVQFASHSKDEILNLTISITKKE